MSQIHVVQRAINSIALNVLFPTKQVIPSKVASFHVYCLKLCMHLLGALYV